MNGYEVAVVLSIFVLRIAGGFGIGYAVARMFYHVFGGSGIGLVLGVCAALLLAICFNQGLSFAQEALIGTGGGV